MVTKAVTVTLLLVTMAGILYGVHLYAAVLPAAVAIDIVNWRSLRTSDL